jgi:hypothetical protein
MPNSAAGIGCMFARGPAADTPESGALESGIRSKAIRKSCREIFARRLKKLEILSCLVIFRQDNSTENADDFRQTPLLDSPRNHLSSRNLSIRLSAKRR